MILAQWHAADGMARALSVRDTSAPQDAVLKAGRRIAKWLQVSFLPPLQNVKEAFEEMDSLIPELRCNGDKTSSEEVQRLRAEFLAEISAKLLQCMDAFDKLPIEVQCAPGPADDPTNKLNANVTDALERVHLIRAALQTAETCVDKALTVGRALIPLGERARDLLKCDGKSPTALQNCAQVLREARGVPYACSALHVVRKQLGAATENLTSTCEVLLKHAQEKHIGAGMDDARTGLKEAAAWLGSEFRPVLKKALDIVQELQTWPVESKSGGVSNLRECIHLVQKTIEHEHLQSIFGSESDVPKTYLPSWPKAVSMVLDLKDSSGMVAKVKDGLAVLQEAYCFFFQVQDALRLATNGFQTLLARQDFIASMVRGALEAATVKEGRTMWEDKNKEVDAGYLLTCSQVLKLVHVSLLDEHGGEVANAKISTENGKASLVWMQDAKDTGVIRSCRLTHERVGSQVRPHLHACVSTLWAALCCFLWVGLEDTCGLTK